MTELLEGQPPARAYAIVAEELGDDFFVKNPPPAKGVRLTITGTDKIATTWRLHVAKAWELQEKLDGHPGVSIQAHAYDEQSEL